jgi:hypothetical protein
MVPVITGDELYILKVMFIEDKILGASPAMYILTVFRLTA